jgi:transmembrane sensor
MTPSNGQIRAAIAEQANEWFVENRAAPLDREASARFMAWLKTSPVHVAEYLAAATVAAEMKTAARATQTPLETLLARARAAADKVVTLDHPLPEQVPTVPRHRVSPVWSLAAAAVLVFVAVAALWLTRDGERFGLARTYVTAHGEQSERRLPDGSVLHLNTDTRVTVRYSRSERLVKLAQGEALFEVVPQGTRAFRVTAGTTNVVAVGTAFAVRQEPGSTLVTVVRGRVAVSTTKGGNFPVQVDEGYAVRVLAGQPPGAVVPADLSRATAWLHRQIIFESEPLGAVAIEFNRYSVVPIEIETPALRTLPVSGVFSVDDTDTFLAFLRSLEGVSVASTATRIRVFQSAAAAPARPPDRH